MRFVPDERWDRRPARAIVDAQLAKLRRFLAEVVLPFSPHYREMFKKLGIEPKSIRTLDDWADVPFTSKVDMVPSETNPEGPRRFILQPTPELIRSEWPKSKLLGLAARRLFFGEKSVAAAVTREYNPVSILFTTGRSAASLPFFLSLYDLDILGTTGSRIVDVLELAPRRDKVMCLFPYAPHLAFWQVHECGRSRGILTLSTGGGRVMGGDKIIEILQKVRPTLVSGMPGYFYHVLRKARERGVKFDSIEKVALGGEAVSPELKTRIISILSDMGARNPRVASVLGFTEARQCWSECVGADDTGFHTSPDLALFEIVDPKTGARLPEGSTGELVFTALDGRGSILLRYRTGDIVEGGITTEVCRGCGRSVPRIATKIRRVSNIKQLDITKVKGTLVNLNTVGELLAGDKDVEEWQVVIAKENDDPLDVDVFRLACALRPGTDAGAFRERIQRDVLALTEVHFNDVEVTGLDDMLTRVGMETNTKEERIVDRRGKTADRKGGAVHGPSTG